MRPLYIAVCGGGSAPDDETSLAEEVGRRIAEAGAVVVTGGHGGVMEAAARGAVTVGGMAIGVLSSGRTEDSNPYNTVVIATGMGEARNVVVVNSSDALIAIGGEFGTLSEIAFALRAGLTVVGLGTWSLARDGLEVPIIHAAGPQGAVEKALTAAERRRTSSADGV